MKRTIIAIILLTFVIGISMIYTNSDRSDESLDSSDDAKEFKDRGGLILEEAGIGYGFNTQRGSFEFEAEFGITNVYTFNVTISDPNITVLVFNVTIHHAPLEPVINIASWDYYELKPLQISEADHYQEINKTFHQTDNQFDFKLIVRGIITSTPFEGPFELTWERSLGISYPGGLPVPVNDSDIDELFRLTLERALVDKEIPDYNLIKDKKNIVLSTENVRMDLVPEIPGVNLLVMEPDQIQRKANREGDFLYLRFSKFKLLTNKTAVVQLDNIWMKSKTSTVMYVSGGGFTIFYHKESGQWEDEVVSMWIS